MSEQSCFKCKQKGHYANKCPNPRINQVQEEETPRGEVQGEVVGNTNEEDLAGLDPNNEQDAPEEDNGHYYERGSRYNYTPPQPYWVTDYDKDFDLDNPYDGDYNDGDDDYTGYDAYF